MAQRRWRLTSRPGLGPGQYETHRCSSDLSISIEDRRSTHLNARGAYQPDHQRTRPRQRWRSRTYFYIKVLVIFVLFLRHQAKAFHRLPPANRRPDGKAEQHDGSLPPYLHQLRAKRLRASSFLRHRSFNHSHFIFHHLELNEDWKSIKRYAMESIQPQSL